MSFRRRPSKQEHATEEPGFGPSWRVPSTFNFAHDVIPALAAGDRRRTAMIHAAADGTVDRLTFADLLHESIAWERLLEQHGLGPGCRVVLALDPGKDWAAAILGALRIGLIAVPVGDGLDPDQLAERARAVDPALVVVGRRSAAAAGDAVSRLPAPIPIQSADEVRWGAARSRPQAPPERYPVSTDALILFSAGGSSGRPRPIVHTHAATFAAYVPARDWLGAQPTDRIWCAERGGSATAVWQGLFGPWSAGAEVLCVDEEIESDDRVELMRRFPPTIVVQQPAAHARLLDELEERGLHLARLRNAASTGARLSLALRRRFGKTMGVDLLDGYGTTETGVVVFQPFGLKNRAGSIGAAAPGHVVAPIDDDGVALPPGVMGDLAVYGRPPSLFAGCWGEARDLDEWGRPGWTPTGDRAAVDEDDNLWLEKQRTPARAAAPKAGPTGSRDRRERPAGEHGTPTRPDGRPRRTA